MLISTDEKSARPVPLKKVVIEAHVIDMTYENIEKNKIKAVYKFMIHDTVAVCGFEATIDNKRKIIGIVKEAEQAKEYDEAIKQGHGAYLLEEQDSEVFKCSVGNIMPGQKIEIQIKYMIELKHDAETDSVRFTLPATIAPKYGSHIFNHKKMRLFDKISDLDFPPLEFSIVCRMNSPICSIKSPSHNITELKEKPSISKVTLNENIHFLEKDFILLVKSQDIDKPRAFIEYNPITETNCLMLTLVPTFKHGSIQHNLIKMELIFIIDRSMKGRSIEKASKALQYLLLSIPESCFFNVLSIGHRRIYNFFEKSREWTKPNVEEAIKKVQKITAKGGTHIYEALEWVFEHSRSDMPTSVLLFSDFETSHTSRIVKLIKDHQEKKHDLRIFSIGMNNIVSNHFIESIARVGKGYAQYVSDLEQMNKKAMTMLRNSLNPPISDYEITWTVEPNEESQNSGLKVQQVPLKIPELYIGVRSIIYCILEKGVKPCDQITLKSKFQDPLIVPLDQSPLQGSKIHTLATKKLIREIEYGNYYPNHAKNEEYIRKQIVNLAKSYNLSSKYTSFTAVETQSIEDHEKKKQEIEKKLFAEKYQIPKMQNAFGEKAMMNEKFKDLERQKEVELKKEILGKENEIERLKKAERKKGIGFDTIEIIKTKITYPKTKSPEFSSSLATAINHSYLKDAASKYKDDWVEKYDKARDYLSKQIGDAEVEIEVFDSVDEYVNDKTTDKVIDEKKRDEIDLKKDEIPKVEEPKAKASQERCKKDNSLQFPSGDFYIKSAISLSDVSTSSASAQNMVFDIKRSLCMPWCIVKDGTKAIIAQQKNVDQDGHQLWHHENGLLINKQTNLCLEVESVKEGTYLSVHQKRNSNQSNNQRWILTTEGHIALRKNPKFVIEVLFKGTAVKDGSYLTLTNTKSKNFKDDLRSKFVIVHKKQHLDCAIIGIIRLELISAKNIDSSFTKGKSYIRIFNEASKETVTQTKIIDNDLDPIWNEVHYLPIKNIGDKFMFDVMDYCSSTEDKSLGNYHFEVNRDFVKEISEGIYEGTQNDIDIWAKLSTKGQIHYRAKFFSLEPLPIPTPDFLSDLKENPFNLSTLCVIIALQALNGSFPPSNTLANLFGYESPVKLFDLYKSHCCEDRVLNIDKTVWTTSMIIWFLKSMLKEYRREWASIYERAEQYINDEVHCDQEIEKIVLDTGEKAVHGRFNIR
ncbi:29067_t:CDS:10, partial [Racocetra persica]